MENEQGLAGTNESDNEKFYKLTRAFAHELRTSLATLNLASGSMNAILPEILKGHELALHHGLLPTLDAKRAQIFERAFQTLFTQLMLTTDELNLRLEYLRDYAMLPTSAEPIDMAERLETLLHSHFFEKDAKQLVERRVAKNVLIHCPVRIFNDLLIGLLRNSLQYACGKPIQIWSEEDENFCTLHVKDSGVGIEPVRHPRVFSRLFSKHEERPIAGLGFCKAVIEKLGGSLSFDTEPSAFMHFRASFLKKKEDATPQASHF